VHNSPFIKQAIAALHADTAQARIKHLLSGKTLKSAFAKAFNATGPLVTARFEPREQSSH
jgi:hypothetical protein